MRLRDSIGNLCGCEFSMLDEPLNYHQQLDLLYEEKIYQVKERKT